MDDHSITGSDEVICKISDNAKCIRRDIHTHVQVDGYALITWLSMYFLGDSGIRFLVFTVLGRLKGPDICNIHVPPYRQNKRDESNEKTVKWEKK